MTLRMQKILTMIVMDVVLLTELCWSIWRASTAEDFSHSFLTLYVPMFLPTVTLFIWRLRHLNKRIASEETALQADAAGAEARA